MFESVWFSSNKLLANLLLANQYSIQTKNNWMRKIKLWHLFSHLFFYMIGGLRGSDTTLKSVKSRREMDELGMDELGLDELDMEELGLYKLGMDKLGLDELGMDELDMDEFVMDELGMGKQLGMTHAPAFQYYYSI